MCEYYYLLLVLAGVPWNIDFPTLSNQPSVDLFRTTSLLHQRQVLSGVNVGPIYFTIILQSSVGTPEGHSEVGVYLASFRVPN